MEGGCLGLLVLDLCSKSYRMMGSMVAWLLKTKAAVGQDDVARSESARMMKAGVLPDEMTSTPENGQEGQWGFVKSYKRRKGWETTSRPHKPSPALL